MTGNMHRNKHYKDLPRNQIKYYAQLRHVLRGQNIDGYNPFVGKKNCLGETPRKKEKQLGEKIITQAYNPVDGKWSKIGVLRYESTILFYWNGQGVNDPITTPYEGDIGGGQSGLHHLLNTLLLGVCSVSLRRVVM